MSSPADIVVFDDCWTEIFRHLDIFSQVRTGLTCKLFHRLLLGVYPGAFAVLQLVDEHFRGNYAEEVPIASSHPPLRLALGEWHLRCNSQSRVLVRFTTRVYSRRWVKPMAVQIRCKSYGNTWRDLPFPADVIMGSQQMDLIGPLLVLLNHSGTQPLYVWDTRDGPINANWHRLQLPQLYNWTLFSHGTELLAVCVSVPKRILFRYNLQTSEYQQHLLPHKFMPHLGDAVFDNRLYTSTGLLCLRTLRYYDGAGPCAHVLYAHLEASYYHDVVTRPSNQMYIS